MLEGLRNRITELISLYEGERQRGDELATKLEQAQTDITAYKEQIEDLKRQIDNLRLSTAFSPAGAGPEAKARLDKVIAEIDRCINLLES